MGFICRWHHLFFMSENFIYSSFVTLWLMHTFSSCVLPGLAKWNRVPPWRVLIPKWSWSKIARLLGQPGGCSHATEAARRDEPEMEPPQGQKFSNKVRDWLFHSKSSSSRSQFPFTIRTPIDFGRKKWLECERELHFFFNFINMLQ